MRDINQLFCVGFLLALVAGATQPLYGQNDNAFLVVCNKGDVRVEVVVANTNFIDSTWTVKGTTVAPRGCETVYDDDGPAQKAFVGFGFKNAQGEFVSGRVPSVPDWGTYEYPDMLLASMHGKTKEIVLAPLSGKTACVHADATLYSSSDATFPSAIENCRRFSVTGPIPAGSGGFYPLTFALEFHPAPSRCAKYDSRVPNAPLCGSGDYHMNIVADAASGVVTVKTGTREGGDAPPAQKNEAMELQDKMNRQFNDALAKAAVEAEERRAAEKAAEDPMAKAEAARKAYEERQSHINYIAEHERNLRRVRELGEFSPQWLSSTEPLYVRGTVSRVELPSKRGQPAKLYFKESPDGAFIACVWPAVFDDIEHFAGERLEVRGRVTRPSCGGKVADVQVAIPPMIIELDKGLPGDEEVLPGMTITSPPNVHTTQAHAGDRQPEHAEPVVERADMRSAGRGSPATLTSRPGPAIGDSSTIPPGTQFFVALTQGIDLLSASDGQTVEGQLAGAATLRDGRVIPQGSGVVIRFLRTPTENPGYSTLTLVVESIRMDGRVVSVNAVHNAGMARPAMRANRLYAYAPGKTLVFTVSTARGASDAVK